MARVTYSNRLDTAAVRRLLTGPNGGVARDLHRRGLLVETQAKRNLGGVGGPRRVDNGRLRSSVQTQMVTRNGAPAALVGSNVWYARFVHDGTGLYGPLHHYITPRHARFLRFRPKGSKRFVYARRVRGMVPNPFLVNALPAARG